MESFLAMVSHYVFETTFCNPAAGWEKGQIEKKVQDGRHQLWQPMPNFPTLDALNEWLERRCQELWSEMRHESEPGTIADVWRSELPSLVQISRPFDGFIEQSKSVSSTCLICFERTRYSVPTPFANLLHRLVDGKSAEVGKVEAPQALTLAKEPRADVERYDGLRKPEEEARHAS
jgi:hypothetical protein